MCSGCQLPARGIRVGSIGSTWTSRTGTAHPGQLAAAIDTDSAELRHGPSPFNRTLPMRFAPPGSAILKALPRSPHIWTRPFATVKHTGFGEGKGCCHLSGLWLGIRIPTASMENSRTSPGTSYWPQKPLRSNKFERCRSDRSCHRVCITNATVVGRCLSRLVLTAPVSDRGGFSTRCPRRGRSRLACWPTRGATGGKPAPHGRSGAGREPVHFLPRQQCPTDARVFVCYRHHRPVVAPLPDQALDPTTPGV